MTDQLIQVLSESETGALESGRRLFMSPRWHSHFHLAIKRALDISVSAILLLLLAPVFLLLAIAVKLSSPGPIFYRWKVVGCGGRPFIGYKFRSMVVGADALRGELASRNEMTGPVFKIADDPRITKVGGWILFLDGSPSMQPLELTVGGTVKAMLDSARSVVRRR